MNQLSAIRDDYVRRFRPGNRAVATFYSSGTLSERVNRAALAETPQGRKHRHQRRIPPSKLKAFAERLAGRTADMASARSFLSLLKIVEDEATTGIGELAVYDTAVRIGYGLNLEPERIYLHAGTRKGARRLNLGKGKPSISVEELPKEFAGLSPAEAEDVLCIYSPYFGQSARRFLAESCDTHSTGACCPDLSSSCQ